VAGEVTPLLSVDLRRVMFVAQPHSRPGQAPVLRAAAASCRPVCVHEGGGCAWLGQPGHHWGPAAHWEGRHAGSSQLLV